MPPNDSSPGNSQLKTAPAFWDEVTKHLEKMVSRHLIRRVDPRLKQPVLRRVLEKIFLTLFESRIASLGPIHKGVFEAAYLFEKIPLVLSQSMLEAACREIFSGQVIPVQRAKADVLKAKRVSLGRCICRYSGRANDLWENSSEARKIYMRLQDPEARLYLDRILNRYQELKDRGVDIETGPEFREVLDRFGQYRKSGHPLYSMANFWKETYPYWEILLKHDDYAPEWMTSLRKNHHALDVHREIVAEWVDAMYYTRGAIFTSMKIVDARYTICACPGPENDQGCLIFNWYFYSGNEGVLQHNTTDFYGQRKDEAGNVLPCNKYQERASKDCLGCGCIHSEKNNPLGVTNGKKSKRKRCGR